MTTTENALYEQTVASYLAKLNKGDLPPAATMERDLLDLLIFEIQKENTTRSSGKIRIPTVLPECVVAMLILNLYEVRNIM